MNELPKDVLNLTVSFLSSKAALRLRELSSSFRDTISLSTLTDPKALLMQKTWYGTHDETSNTPSRSVWIPVLFPNRTHSIILTCNWRDQGHGNRKGALFVVAVDVNDDPNTTTLESIENGKIVYQSPLAPHEEENLQMPFNYSPSKAYYLWYRIGGGGGHQLQVRNLEMHTIIHDSPGNWIGRTYKVLESQEFCQDNNRFSLGMLRLLATIGQEENTQAAQQQLTTFLSDTGFDVSKASMKALEEIATALLKCQRQDAVHAALEQNRNENPRVGRVPLQFQGDHLLDHVNNRLDFVWAAPPMRVEPFILNPFEDDEIVGIRAEEEEEEEVASLDATMEDLFEDRADDEMDNDVDNDDDESDEDESDDED